MEPYYQDELVTLYHARCEDVLPTLPGGSIDAVICDLPYGITNCAWDTPIAFDFMWREIKRLVKPRAAVVLFGSQPFTSALVMSNPKWFKYELIWHKERGNEPQMANIRPMKAHENIVVFANGATTYHPQKTPIVEPDRRAPRGERINRRDGSGLNILSGSTNDVETIYIDRFPISVLPFENGNQIRKAHPSQKPLALLEYLVKTYADPGATVLDFTSGSGTTPRACKNLGRRCIAVEMLEQYCAATVKRLAPRFEEAVTVAPADYTGTLFEGL